MTSARFIAAMEAEQVALEKEVLRGVELHGHYQSTHEALGVILEEWDEFKVEIKKNDNERAVVEARQVAATALRFCIEFG